jgi:hypothetical protein
MWVYLKSKYFLTAAMAGMGNKYCQPPTCFYCLVVGYRYAHCVGPVKECAICCPNTTGTVEDGVVYRHPVNIFVVILNSLLKMTNNDARIVFNL